VNRLDRNGDDPMGGGSNEIKGHAEKKKKGGGGNRDMEGISPPRVVFVKKKNGTCRRRPHRGGKKDPGLSARILSRNEGLPMKRGGAPPPTENTTAIITFLWEKAKRIQGRMSGG